MIACFNGNPNIVQLLVEKLANIDVKNKVTCCLAYKCIFKCLDYVCINSRRDTLV